MNDYLAEMFERTDERMDATHRIREVLQRFAICSLSESGFFEGAAFVGGTALRLFHGLDRFSEDIDLTLLEPDEDFDLGPYLSRLEDDFSSMDLRMEIREKDKTFESKMRSAFIKGNSREIHLQFGANSDNVQFDQRIMIKLELDVDPPSDCGLEIKQGIMPYPHTVRMYDMPTMHACKLHAILCRNWGNRVKGRDYYDVLYYASRGTGVNTSHLVKRLCQSGIQVDDGEDIRAMLKDRFARTDYADAVSDVRPFVTDRNRLRNWSPELFVSIADGLEFVRTPAPVPCGTGSGPDAEISPDAIPPETAGVGRNSINSEDA